MFRKLAASICLFLVITFQPLLSRELPAVAGLPLEAVGGAFSIDFSSYQNGKLARLPIGVFDSGVGGLTVLAQILQLDSFNNETGSPGADGRADFEGEKFIYLGDQANMPYGNYPAEGRTEFLRELVLKDAIFLLGRRYWKVATAAEPSFDKLPVKALVIACNTATAYGIEDLLAAVERWRLPVYVVGVVNAGARGALEKVGKQGAVAVMATEGTCSSEGYVRAVEQAWREAGLEPPVVIQQGCLGLAGSIEGDRAYIDPSGAGDRPAYHGPAVTNSQAPLDTMLFAAYGFTAEGLLGSGQGYGLLRLNSVENYIRYHTLTLVNNYSHLASKTPIKGVILGCTHFPFFSSEFTAAFDRLRSLDNPDGSAVKPYAALLAPELALIDPAENTAVELYNTLHARNLLLVPGEACAIRTDEFYISVPSPGLERSAYDNIGAFSYAYKYSREPGKLTLEYVRRTPMQRGNLSEEARTMIKKSLPEVWRRLVEFNRESPRLAGFPDSLRLN